MARAQSPFSDRPAAAANRPALQIRLLGPVAIVRDGGAVALPPSRKLQALLAYLLLARAPVSRSQLCQLLWERPGDPRGELRWYLSKLRRIVDDPGRRRIHARGDAIGFDAGDCEVDVLAIERMSSGLDATTLASGERRRLSAQWAGDFLEGLDMARSPLFDAWLTGQRRRYRDFHAALLRRLAAAAPVEESLDYLERWRAIAPFDREVHERLIAALTRCQRLREAREHVEATTRLFEAEGLDGRPIRDAWRSARLRVAPLRQPLELAA